MQDEVRRGRALVAAYAVLHLIVMFLLLALSLTHGRPWQRVVVRALTQTALIHSLWKGSRWAQWLHVVGFLATAILMITFAVRRPRPVVVSVAGVLSTLFLGLAWMFALSRSIRSFLAYQRGEFLLPEDYERIQSRYRSQTRTPTPETQEELVLDENLVSCRKCGAAMKEFVVVCPECGVRRE